MTISEGRLSGVQVRDVMNTGLLMTDPDTSLRVVARLMAEQQVHAVAVADPDHARRPWGLISVADVLAAAAANAEPTAGEVASADAIVPIAASASLDEAAQIMTEHGLTHLLVIDPVTGHTIGIVSALDIAGAYGG